MSWKKLDEIILAGVAVGAITLAMREERQGSRAKGDDDDDDDDDKKGGPRTVTLQMIARESQEHLESQRKDFSSWRKKSIELGDTREEFDAYVEWKAGDIYSDALRVFRRRSGPNPGQKINAEHWVEAAYSRFCYIKNRHLYDR